MTVLFIISIYLLRFSDVTFDIAGDSTFVSTQETEAVEENVQGVGEWSTYQIFFNSMRTYNVLEKEKSSQEKCSGVEVFGKVLME